MTACAKPPHPQARGATLVVTLALLVTSACAHQTTVLSEPPGALVFIDGDHRGETPLVVEGTTGAPGVERVEVRDPRTGESLRFDLLHDSFQTEAVVAAILAGVATFFSAGLLIIPFMVGYVSLYVAVFTVPFGGVDPTLAIGGFLAAFALLYGSYATGILLAASAPTVALFLLGEGTRVGPDEVFVDFSERDVTTSPPDLVVPLAGGVLAKKQDPSALVDDRDHERTDVEADTRAPSDEPSVNADDAASGATSDDKESPMGATSDDSTLIAPDEFPESLEDSSLPHP